MGIEWEGGLASSCFHLFGNKTLSLYLCHIGLTEVFHYRHLNYRRTGRRHPSKRNLLSVLMDTVNLSCKHNIRLQENRSKVCK